MKKQKLKLSQLEVKSFTIGLSSSRLQTVKGGRDTTPDNTPHPSEPIKLPATGNFCPSAILDPNGCMKDTEICAPGTFYECI